jgi:hypothetical protein
MGISNVSKLGQIQTAAGLIENSPINCQIASVFPFMGIDGYGIEYASRPKISVTYPSNSTAPAQYLSESATGITEHTDSPDKDDSGSTVATSATYYLTELATRYVIPYSQQDRYTYPNELSQTEKLLAERRLMYRYFSFIGQSGSSVSDGSDMLGLPGLVDSTRTIQPASGTLLMRHIDEAYYMVTDGPGRPNAIMSHSRALRTVFQLLYDTSGKVWPMGSTEVEMLDPLRGRVMVEVPTWRGTPWYVNDLLEIDTTATPDKAQIFFMLLGDSETPGAGRGITGIVPRDRVGNMFVHRPAAGAVVTAGNAISPNTNMDCVWPVGLACGSRGALSMIYDFNVVANGA